MQPVRRIFLILKIFGWTTRFKIIKGYFFCWVTTFRRLWRENPKGKRIYLSRKDGTVFMEISFYGHLKWYGLPFVGLHDNSGWRAGEPPIEEYGLVRLKYRDSGGRLRVLCSNNGQGIGRFTKQGSWVATSRIAR